MKLKEAHSKFNITVTIYDKFPWTKSTHRKKKIHKKVIPEIGDYSCRSPYHRWYDSKYEQQRRLYRNQWIPFHRAENYHFISVIKQYGWNWNSRWSRLDRSKRLCHEIHITGERKVGRLWKKESGLFLNRSWAGHFPDLFATPTQHSLSSGIVNFLHVNDAAMGWPAGHSTIYWQSPWKLILIDQCSREFSKT